MANELKITLTVDDQGSIKISQVSGELKKLAGTAQQTGREVAASGKQSQQASVDYDRLSRGVAMAQAKLIALYGTVRGSAHLFTSAMESVDYYQKAIIRLAASEADLAKAGEDVGAVYERAKGKYKELVEYAMVASSKYFANAREMLTVMEYATSRGHEVTKETDEGVRSLREIFSKTATDWQNAVTDTVNLQQEGGDSLRESIEAATHIFRQTMSESGGDFKEAVNQAGGYFKEKFETIVFPSQGSWWENMSTGGSFFNLLPFFHSGGIIRAHDGYLAKDERVIIAQTGEGILPRGSMASLGRENFEALRRGDFERVDLRQDKRGGGITVHVHINALDRAGVEAIDWDQVVRRQIVPALRRVEGRRV